LANGPIFLKQATHMYQPNPKRTVGTQPWRQSRARRFKRRQRIHSQYDGIGFIPLDELIKEETA
jgi:hypothetical protein